MTDQAKAADRPGRPMDITTGEFAGTVVAVFLMGGLAGWGLFGERFELANRAWGNVAEWFAAFGTIVVGYGAWKYARANLLSSLARGDEDTARRLVEERNLLSGTFFKLQRLTNVKRSFSILEKQQFRVEGIVHQLVEIVVDEVMMLDASDSRTLAFSTRVESEFWQVMVRSTGLIKQCRVLLRDVDGSSGNPISTDTQQLIDAVRESSEKLSTMAESLAKQLQKRIASLNSALAEVRARQRARARLQ